MCYYCNKQIIFLSVPNIKPNIEFISSQYCKLILNLLNNFHSSFTTYYLTY